jgi:phage gpG-like protein
MAAGVSISIDINLAPLRAGVEALREIGDQPRDVWDVIGRRWVDLTRERFAEGTAPDGTPWVPSLRAKATGGQTMVDQRHLEDSVTHEADDGGVSMGTAQQKAPALQFGATIKPKKAKALRFVVPGVGPVFARKVTIPPRPFIGMNQSYVDEFAALAASRLERKVEEAKNGGGEGAAP